MSIDKYGHRLLPQVFKGRLVLPSFISHICAAALAIALIGLGGQSVRAGEQTAGSSKNGPVTGLPLPRYVSLKASRVNLRNGPGTKYPTAWVFRQAGMPVEVISEFEAWRKVRDSEGTKGWVLRTLLSGRRTAQIAPWDVKGDKARPRTAVTKRPKSNSTAIALIEAGVIADIQSCDGQWCYVRISKFTGYLPQIKLWGVYKNERIP